MTPREAGLIEGRSSEIEEERTSPSKQQQEAKPVEVNGPEESSRKEPRTSEEARREMFRLICANSTGIVEAVIKDAREGRYLSAKFLFDLVGLSAINAEDVEDPAERESLASLLLKRWRIAPQGEDVTEVSEVTSEVDQVSKAPVES